MRHSIFVIDDDQTFRIRASMTLRQAGYQVYCAANGDEALADLLALAKTPSLILVDLVMPVMDGWRFREIQRANSKLSHIPIIALSDAPVGNEYLGLLKALGVLVKPIAHSHLLKAVILALDEHGADTQRRPSQNVEGKVRADAHT